MNDLFWTILEELYKEDSDNFNKSVTCIEEIRNLTNMYQNMQCSSPFQVIIEKVPDTDLQIVKH